MKTREIVLVAVDVRSLFNVGSFFRTGDAFGISKIYLCGITGTPDSLSADKITKVSLGAEKSVPWEYKENTIDLLKYLKSENYLIISLEQDKKSVTKISNLKNKKIALFVGNEVDGLSKQILKKSDIILELPMLGNKESLNVSVATGIALHILKNIK